MSRLWEELCKGQLLRLDHKIADGALRTETAKEAYKLFAQAEDCPSMRHIAFMTLQKLANKAPSMYKEPRADHPPDGEPPPYSLCPMWYRILLTNPYSSTDLLLFLKKVILMLTTDMRKSHHGILAFLGMNEVSP